MHLHEQFRPKCWDEVVAQDKIVKLIKRLAATRGLGGKNYWISGQTGTGKTTIARLLALEVAEDWCIDEVDAKKVTPAWIESTWATFSLIGPGKGGRAVIINEAHMLSTAAITSLLVALERIPNHCVCIFTTTCEGQQFLFDDKLDANPLLHRCLPLELSRRNLAEEFAKMVKKNAESVGLDGRDLADYIRLAKDCRNSPRAMYARVEAGWGLEGK